jgi:SAM-dependent methyltransferase
VTGDGPLRCPCEGRFLKTLFSYDAPPPGETPFPIEPGEYRREFRRCGVCRHFVASHALDLDGLYQGQYVDATYGSDGFHASFDRIVSLPPELSDNTQRVRRVVEFAAARALGTPPSALDVGSGLCVFLHRLRDLGWRCTAIDPDTRAVDHARSVVGVEAVAGDFLALDDLGRFDLVSFNKVIEHVADPVGLLAKGVTNVEDNGFIYVEVPDGEAAAADGPDREEFFVDHLHVFSAASLALAAARAGLRVLRLDRLREPSTKYTLAAFLERSGR